MDKKNKITNINARADEELKGECKHDPICCIEGLKSEVRVARCVDIMSNIAEGNCLSYIEFCEVVGRLLHYYESIAKLQGIEPEELMEVPAVMYEDFE